MPVPPVPGRRPFTGRRLLRGALAAVAVVLCAVGGTALGTAPASAHAQLVSSTPAEGTVVSSAPKQVELEFNERVQVHAEDTHVFVGDGSEVDADVVSADRTVTVTPPSDLPEGTVVVSYSVTSADGHRINGSVTFAVGAPTPGSSSNAAFEEPTTAGVASVATAVRVLALAAGVGLVLLAALALLRALPLNRLPLNRQSLNRQSLNRLPWARLLEACWLVGLVAAVLAVPLSVVDRGGFGWGGLLSWDHWIDGFVTWQGLLVAVAVVAAAIAVGALRRAPVVRRSVVVAVAAAVVLAGAGTASLAAPGADPVPVDGVPAGDPVGEATAGEATVRVSFESLMVGTTGVRMEVLDGDGNPMEPFAAPRMRLHSESINLGDVRLEAKGAGTYAGTVTIPESGEWTVEVSLRVDEFTNPVLELPFEVGRPPTPEGGGH